MSNLFFRLALQLLVMIFLLWKWHIESFAIELFYRKNVVSAESFNDLPVLLSSQLTVRLHAWTLLVELSQNRGKDTWRTLECFFLMIIIKITQVGSCCFFIVFGQNTRAYFRLPRNNFTPTSHLKMRLNSSFTPSNVESHSALVFLQSKQIWK